MVFAGTKPSLTGRSILKDFFQGPGVCGSDESHYFCKSKRKVRLKMRLMEKMRIIKRNDSGFGTQIDNGSSRYGGYPAIADQKAGVIRKTAGVGFLVTGVTIGVIAAISLLIGIVLLVPSVVSVCRQYFGKRVIPFTRQ